MKIVDYDYKVDDKIMLKTKEAYEYETPHNGPY